LVNFTNTSGKKLDAGYGLFVLGNGKQDMVVETLEEELLPACSNSSRESNYHDSQGEN